MRTSGVNKSYVLALLVKTGAKLPEDLSCFPTLKFIVWWVGNGKVPQRRAHNKMLCMNLSALS